MKKIIKLISETLLIAAVVGSTGFVGLALAQDIDNPDPEETPLFTEAEKLGEGLVNINKENFAEQLGTFINYLLTILGLVTLLYLLYGGVVMLTSQGNEEKLADARKIITYAIIGVVIIALAFAINAWIFGSEFFRPGETS